MLPSCPPDVPVLKLLKLVTSLCRCFSNKLQGKWRCYLCERGNRSSADRDVLLAVRIWNRQNVVLLFRVCPQTAGATNVWTCRPRNLKLSATKKKNISMKCSKTWSNIRCFWFLCFCIFSYKHKLSFKMHGSHADHSFMLCFLMKVILTFPLWQHIWGIVCNKGWAKMLCFFFLNNRITVICELYCEMQAKNGCSRV